ncbi:MAG: hypothetical protein NE327_20610 [Lentisphaeraceae bacterium]|nr:hypothetical protein [Lentisphaeraceae bacterium]
MINKEVNSNGLTELHLGAYHQEVEWVENCINAGFDVNKTDKNGYTPIAWAIDMSLTSESGTAITIIKLLLKNGADLDRAPNGFQNLTKFIEDRNPTILNEIEQLKLENKRSGTD